MRSYGAHGVGIRRLVTVIQLTGELTCLISLKPLLAWMAQVL
ncbi:hypothetical protein EVA_17730 [gut metagenome]|uniref:Uncharacterized protein n=1 Tax=gut metagenome TaxID=749906 RepID=J9FIA7_9ZZZZ